MLPEGVAQPPEGPCRVIKSIADVQMLWGGTITADNWANFRPGFAQHFRRLDAVRGQGLASNASANAMHT